MRNHTVVGLIPDSTGLIELPAGEGGTNYFLKMQRVTDLQKTRPVWSKTQQRPCNSELHFNQSFSAGTL